VVDIDALEERKNTRPRERAAAIDGSADGTPPRSAGPLSELDEPERDVTSMVGRRLRQFRKELGLSLRALSELSGLSIGFLSQLERGISSIGLTTLHSLADRLGRDITEFFDEDTENKLPREIGVSLSLNVRGDTATHFTLVRAGDPVPSEYVMPEVSYRMLSKRAPGLVLEPMIVRIAAGHRLGHNEAHDGEEFAYVLEGELCYVVGGVTHRLQRGDSLHLTSSTPHELYNDTHETAVVVSVVTPRLF